MGFDTYGAVTNDGGLNGGVNWTCFGTAAENWGVAPVEYAPASYLGPLSISRGNIPRAFSYWGMIPNLPFASSPATATFAILDPNGNVQVTTFTYSLGGPPRLGGLIFPNWVTTLGAYTTDAGFTWLNYGPIASSWYGTTNYGGYNSTSCGESMRDS